MGEAEGLEVPAGKGQVRGRQQPLQAQEQVLQHKRLLVF